MSVKAPYHWLKGTYPRGETPELVARILSERLGEVVEVRQLWPGRFVRRGSGDVIPISAGGGRARLVPVADEGGRVSVVDAQARLAAVLDWLVEEPGALAGSEVGEPLGDGLLEAVEVRADQVRALAEDGGGAAVLGMAVTDLGAVRELLAGCAYSPCHAVRLHGVAAKLGAVAGLAAAELGRDQESLRHLLAGLSAAQAAGERELGARIVAGMAANLHGREALRLVNAAMRGAPPGRPELDAVLRCRRAVACAELGDLTAFTESAERVLAWARTCEDGDAPGAGALLGELSAWWRRLGCPREAAAVAERALGLLRERRSRRWYEVRATLALVHLDEGSSEAADAVLAAADRGQVHGTEVAALREALAGRRETSGYGG